MMEPDGAGGLVTIGTHEFWVFFLVPGVGWTWVRRCLFGPRYPKSLLFILVSFYMRGFLAVHVIHRLPRRA